MLYRSMLYSRVSELMSSTLNIRLPEAEAKTLTRYAAEAQRSKSEIVRELIRSLRPLTEKRKPQERGRASRCGQQARVRSLKQ